MTHVLKYTMGKPTSAKQLRCDFDVIVKIKLAYYSINCYVVGTHYTHNDDSYSHNTNVRDDSNEQRMFLWRTVKIIFELSSKSHLISRQKSHDLKWYNFRGNAGTPLRFV